jgi:hypothetical protein
MLVLLNDCKHIAQNRQYYIYNDTFYKDWQHLSSGILHRFNWFQTPPFRGNSSPCFESVKVIKGTLKMRTIRDLETSGSDTHWHGVIWQKKWKQKQYIKCKLVVLSGCTSTTVLSCHGIASVEVCRNNRILPAARSEAKPKPKSQTAAALCNTCIFKRVKTSTNPLRYVHTHPLRFLVPFFFIFLYLFPLLSFLSWVITFHPLFIHYFLFPTISFFSYMSTPLNHSFIHSSIVLLLLFFRYHKNFVFFSSSLYLFVCPDSNVP